jgi:hypothetical protein
MIILKHLTSSNKLRQYTRHFDPMYCTNRMPNGTKIQNREHKEITDNHLLQQ